MGNDRIIYIRADGNSNIAAGHLVRCLAIADACHKLGMSVRFLVSDEESRLLLLAFLADTMPRLKIHILKTAFYNDMEKEIPEITALLSAQSSERPSGRPILLLDSYYITEKYLNAVENVAKTVYIDDIQLFNYSVDILINYDIAPEALLPARPKARKMLLGVSYTPLRSQFSNASCVFRTQVSRILITTGGSDPYHFCLKLAEFAAEQMSGLSSRSSCFSSLRFEIVIGKLNTDKDAIFKLAERFSFINPHENVSDMAALMKDCDLAVSAAGTTLYELCATGIPTLSFTMADNQLNVAKAFSDAGIIPLAGDIRTSFSDVLKSVTDFIMDMSKNNDKRKSAHEKMSRFIDGNGSMRIAQELSML